MNEKISSLRESFERELEAAKNSEAVEKLRVAYLGKKELDPADYQKFLEGYAKLSSKELEICAALAKGLSARQCAEQTGNALSTIDTYRKRVYGKTNIHRVRQLRLCYALMQLEQAEQDK